MGHPASTLRRGGRRAAVALVAIATGLSVPGAVAPSAAAAPAAAALPADPGDSAKYDQLSKQIAKLDKAYGGDLAKLRDAQYAAKKALDKAKVLQSDLIEARDLVAQLAANQYMMNGEDPSVSVLSSDNPSEVLNNASLINHLARNKAARVGQIQKLIDEQEQARKEAQKKVDELRKEIKDLLAKKAQIRTLVKKYKPESPSAGMGGVTPRMLKVKNTLDVEFGPFPMIGCVRYTGDPQDHGTGHACDFMVTTGGAVATGNAQRLGDQAAQYAITHASRLGVKYVIWRQRIYDMRSPGWRFMENRGGATANHYDHVHISVF